MENPDYIGHFVLKEFILFMLFIYANQFLKKKQKKKETRKKKNLGKSIFI